MTAELIFRDTSNVEISTISFGDSEPGETSTTTTVRIYNSGDSAPDEVLIGAMTIDAKFTGATNGAGQEAITEKWLQVKEGAGDWTPIGGDPTAEGNTLSITPPAPGAYTEISFRQVIPESPTTSGPLAYMPFAFYPPEA